MPILKLLTFDEFIEWLPENRHYELHDGVIVEMQPTGKHEDVTGFLTQELTLEYTRLHLPQYCSVKVAKLPRAEGAEAALGGRGGQTKREFLSLCIPCIPCSPCFSQQTTLLNRAVWRIHPSNYRGCQRHLHFQNSS